MITQILGWENVLMSWAQQCFEEPEHTPGLDASVRELNEAYAACASLTAFHSRTFHMASALLPPQKQRAVRALYAFCRRTDDLVDRPGAAAAEHLAKWREAARSPRPPHDDLPALAWADTRLRYRIPGCYIEQFFDGVGRDLRQSRYDTFHDLAQYAYGVASTVGLMVAHIIGFAGPQAIPYAVKLGVALQITNILRDIREDWDAGRLYLPQEELAAFGLGEGDIAAGRNDKRWRSFMAFQVARNRRLYAEARPGIAMLSRDGRFAIAAAATLYEGILDDIAAHDYDVFSRRAHLGTAAKLRRLPGIWWQARAGK